MTMNKNYTLKPQPQKVRIAVNGSPSTRAEMEESYRRYSELWNSQGGCMLYMAMQQWKDAYELLQEHPMYKQRVKQLAKRIDAAWNKMWDIMRQCFESKWNVYCDSLNQMYLNLEQDILFLFLAMKRVLDHNKIPDSNFVARQQMALHCAKHAWIVYERFWSIRDAKILGIFKSAECYDRQHRKGQFKSGHKPFNKGRDIRLWASKEAQEKIASTYYKKGVPPKNSPTLRPAGYERIRRYKSGKAYIYIKPEGRRMMPKHRWLWEQAHGPIPKGYNVQFKDGNSLNCTLDNLYLISKAKQIRKNFDALPAERKAEVWAKMHETRNKAIRRDQLRLRWGLEPRGGLVKRLPK